MTEEISTTPKVSVIIPVYNSEQYLGDCVRSVQQQIYRNLEIILIDDGSTDKSKVICEEFCRIDDRVQAISQKHKGVSAARNCGLDAHTGEYVFFMDSDDLIHPNLIYQYVLYMNESSVDYIYCPITRFIVPPMPEEYICVIPELATISPQKARASFYQSSPRGIGGKIFRSQFIGNLRFAEDMHFGEDSFFVYQALLKGGRPALFNAPWYYYRQHPESACAHLNDNIGMNLRFITAIRDHEYANRDIFDGGYFFALRWEKMLVGILSSSWVKAKKRRLKPLYLDLHNQYLAEIQHPLFTDLPVLERIAFYLCFKNLTMYKAARKGGHIAIRMKRKLAGMVRIAEKPIYQVENPNEEKRIAITFNATYGAENTDKILDILRKRGVRATFFASGIWVDAFREKAIKLIDTGCEVMNYSDTLQHFPQCRTEDILEELESCSSKIEAVTGIRPTLIRCPYGEYDSRVMECIRQTGMLAIQWSVDSLDWKETSTPESIRQRILSQIKSGGIILCNNAGRYTPYVLDNILEELMKEGYQFVTVSELIG